MKVLLVCSQGMSTSLLAQKMERFAKNEGIDATVFAAPGADIAEHAATVDAVLIGPQAAYLEARVREACAAHGVPAEMISMLDYGMVNGEKIMKRALELVCDNGKS